MFISNIRRFKLKNLIIVLFIFVGIGSGLFAQETEPTNEELLEKIEILEAELEKVKIEAEDNSPLAAGETLDWGRGLSLGIQYSSASDVQLDFMYNFPIGTWGQEGYYNSNSQGRKLGIGLLFGTSLDNENYLDKAMIDENSKAFLKLGPKFSISSPIMMNYISVTTYLSPYLNFIMLDDDSLGGIDFGLELGSEINVWLNSQNCFYAGFMTDPTLATVSGDEDFSNPLSFKITFGLKSFF